MSEDRLEGIERIINMRQYLTPVSRDNKDIQSVMDTETVEFQELWNALCDCFNNVYVKYMMQYGLSQWESIYKLHPHADETYADRRKRILAAFAGTRPYTLRKFQEMLDTIYGKGTLTPIVDGNKYLFNMQINWDFDSRLDNLHEFVEEIVPKNLLIRYTYFLIPWDEVGDIDDDFTTSIDVSPAVADEYPWPGRRLDGSWTLGGRRHLDGEDRIDGSWKLDGRNDGLVTLDGGVESLVVSCIQFLGGSLSDNTARSIGLDEGQPLDGSWTLGENAAPLDTSGELEIKRLHRLDGTWKLDGGERLRLGGAFRLDGTHDLRQRGNRLAIRRTHARI